MKFDKKEIFKGLFIGFIITLLICSICKVTFYGLDYAVSVSSVVIGKNLLYMVFASIIAFFIQKTKISKKIVLVSNLLLIIFGIFVIVGQNLNIVTKEFVIPGPTILVPNIIWFTIIAIITIGNTSLKNKKWKNILNFLIGESLATVMICIMDLVLGQCMSNGISNALEINNNINYIIRCICGVLTVIYSAIAAKKVLKETNKNNC